MFGRGMTLSLVSGPSLTVREGKGSQTSSLSDSSMAGFVPALAEGRGAKRLPFAPVSASSLREALEEPPAACGREPLVFESLSESLSLVSALLSLPLLCLCFTADVTSCRCGSRGLCEVFSSLSSRSDSSEALAIS